MGDIQSIEIVYGEKICSSWEFMYVYTDMNH